VGAAQFARAPPPTARFGRRGGRLAHAHAVWAPRRVWPKHTLGSCCRAVVRPFVVPACRDCWLRRQQRPAGSARIRSNRRPQSSPMYPMPPVTKIFGMAPDGDEGWWWWWWCAARCPKAQLLWDRWLRRFGARAVCVCQSILCVCRVNGWRVGGAAGTPPLPLASMHHRWRCRCHVTHTSRVWPGVRTCVRRGDKKAVPAAPGAVQATTPFRHALCLPPSTLAPPARASAWGVPRVCAALVLAACMPAAPFAAALPPPAARPAAAQCGHRQQRREP
jgi:hypothetical protein